MEKIRAVPLLYSQFYNLQGSLYPSSAMTYGEGRSDEPKRLKAAREMVGRACAIRIGVSAAQRTLLGMNPCICAINGRSM